MQPECMQGWMNKKAVAEYLGLKSERSVERMVAQRKIPKPQTFSRRVYWKKSVLEKWLAGSRYEKACDAELRRINASV